MVEVGATNRTHPHDYERAITDNTAALLRVHPSNFRVVGFAAEVATAELARLAHSRGLICIDDLGAGALVNLEEFGLPHEPTVQESIGASADPSEVVKGKKMPGHMGDVSITVQNLQVVDVVPEKNLLVVRGAVPGARGGVVVVKHSVKGSK